MSKPTSQPTLYKFHLDEGSGAISRIEITDYVIIAPYNENVRQYKFKLNNTYQYAYHRKLDTLSNWNLYSFSDDIYKVTDIIYQSIDEKCTKLAKELYRYNTLRHKLSQNY